MNETACADRVKTLTGKLSDQRCERVGLQNAIDLENPLPSHDEIEEILAEVRLMITEGTGEDHKTLTQALVGYTPVEGRYLIRPSFIVPTQKGSRSVKLVGRGGLEPSRQ